MLTLFYLPLRARAEQIRMILAFGNIPYENVVVNFSEWPTLKGDSTKCPFGQVPALVLPSGMSVAQSGAITRYVSKLAGIYPTNPEMAAKADMVQELAMEMNPINPVLNWFSVNSEQFSSTYASYFAVWDARLVALQNILGNENFFAGENAPSHADFCMYHIMDATLTVKPDALDNFSTIQAWMQRMNAIPQLQSYLSERPQPPHVGREGSLLQSMHKPS